MKHRKKYENSSLDDATKDHDDLISSMEGTNIRSTKLIIGVVLIRIAYLCVTRWAQPNQLMLPLCYNIIVVALQ